MFSIAAKWLKGASECRLARHLRGESRFLHEWHDRLAKTFKDTRCIVIGSAPGVLVPPPASNDRYICVNGSPFVANRFGIFEPHLTVINGVTTGLRTEKSKATVAVWRGLQSKEIVFVRTGDSERHARAVLREVEFRFERFTSLSKHQRAAIIMDVCGEERLGLGNHDQRVSNGVFAACLAAWAGACEIVMCGFSLQGGHSYIDGNTRRDNMSGDSAFFAMSGLLPTYLTTTSPEIHSDFGVPLIGGKPAVSDGSCPVEQFSG